MEQVPEAKLDRTELGLYPRDDGALRHGAGVETETSLPREAYAANARGRPGRYNRGDLPGF